MKKSIYKSYDELPLLLNVKQLAEAGVSVENIAIAGVCTNDNVELFCSYRAEQGKTGRMGVCLCARK